MTTTETVTLIAALQDRFTDEELEQIHEDLRLAPIDENTATAQLRTAVADAVYGKVQGGV